jgi:hypothetical protein
MRQLRWLMAVLACLGALATGCGRRAVVDAVVDDGLATVVKADQHKGPEPAPAAGEPFAFPRDPAGVLLSKRLHPENTLSGPGDRRTEPVPRPTPRFLEVQPGPSAVPPAPGLVPPLPQKAYGLGQRPHLVTEELPPNPVEAVALPQPIVLATTARTRVEAPDVNAPPRLPILAQAISERASLDDATSDASMNFVLAAAMPQRGVMVPFLRLSIPDPYENRRPLTLSLPPEPTDPMLGSPRLP